MIFGNKSIPLRLLLICILLFAPLAAVHCALPAASAAGSNGSVSQEQIDAGRKAAESDTTLNETQKQKALELFDQAAQWLQQADEAMEG